MKTLANLIECFTRHLFERRSIPILESLTEMNRQISGEKLMCRSWWLASTGQWLWFIAAEMPIKRFEWSKWTTSGQSSIRTARIKSRSKSRKLPKRPPVAGSFTNAIPASEGIPAYQNRCYLWFPAWLVTAWMTTQFDSPFRMQMGRLHLNYKEQAIKPAVAAVIPSKWWH